MLVSRVISNEGLTVFYPNGDFNYIHPINI